MIRVTIEASMPEKPWDFSSKVGQIFCKNKKYIINSNRFNNNLINLSQPVIAGKSCFILGGPF